MGTRLAGGAALTGLAGWAAARALVAWIEHNPDPYPRDRLLAEPEGEETLIGRPDGTMLRAVIAGDGPPVILAHGYTATLAEWNVVWDELLARGFRVIAFDHRGHGSSNLGSDGIGSQPMAADVAAVLKHFNVRDGILVGHSMGGFVTIRAGGAAARTCAVRDLGGPRPGWSPAELDTDPPDGARHPASATAQHYLCDAVSGRTMRIAPVAGDGLGIP
jgi:pimeloyl-ACP methyl ester carboxylesterase